MKQAFALNSIEVCGWAKILGKISFLNVGMKRWFKKLKVKKDNKNQWWGFERKLFGNIKWGKRKNKSFLRMRGEKRVKQ